RQFWSTARIETTNEGTKIIATVDGKPMTISESWIRRNLKLNDEDGISSLSNAELFENLALIDDSQREAFSTIFSLEVGQDRENIIKTSALPHDSTPGVTSLDADEGSMPHQLQELTNLCTRLQRQQTKMSTKIAGQDLEISNLKTKVKLLEDKDKGTTELFGDDAPIKGRSLETEEEAGVEKSTERGSNDTEELVNVLTSMDAATILTSGVQAVSVPPATEIPNVGVPTGSGLVPTASPIFTTASVVIPYSRRKGKEKMVESDTPKKKKLQEQIDVQMAREMEEEMAREDQRKNEQIARDAKIARIHAEEEMKMLIDGLDMRNELIAKHYHEYEKFKAELTIGEKIELINELQIEDFVPMSSKEEAKRFKRKGLRLEQGSTKKMKTSEEVSEEDLKEMMQLVPVEEVYVEALQVKHPIIDWEIHSEGQRNYWKIIRLGGSKAASFRIAFGVKLFIECFSDCYLEITQSNNNLIIQGGVERSCSYCGGPFNGGNYPSCSIVGVGNEFVHDPNPFPYDNTPDFYDQPPQYHVETYSCELCGNDSHYGYDCPPQFPLSTIPLRDIISQLPQSIVITTSPPILLTEDPEDSLIIRDEDLNTIPENGSDEVIKSSVEDFVPIPCKFEDTSKSDSECDLPSCDDISPIDVLKGKNVTFSNPLFDSNDDFTASDDESLSDEDVLEDNVKIYSNPLFEFDDEYIFSDVNPLFDEVLHDIKRKASYDSNLDDPALLVTPLFNSNKDECFDLGGDVDTFDTPLDFEDGYYDSKGDVLYLKSFLSDDTTPNLPPEDCPGL
nr:hypothetical protein [Tanacetum cinerariifolium]